MKYNERKRSIWPAVVGFIALTGTVVFGIVGLRVSNYGDLLDDVFGALMMLGLNYGDTPPNIWVNIARFCGAGLALDMIYVIARSAVGAFFNSIGHTYVFGDGEDVDRIVNEKKSEYVRDTYGFRKSRINTYFLLSDEEDNFTFLKEHRNEMKGKSVYVKAPNLPEISAQYRELDVHFFSYEEISTRDYWREYPLYRDAFEYNKSGSLTYKTEMHVVIIGFGKLGEELLYSGIPANVFTSGDEQRIFYDVFCNDQECDRFTSLHNNLDVLNINFHRYEWYKNTDDICLLMKATRIIIADQERQFEILDDIEKKFAIIPPVHLFMPYEIDEELFMYGRHGVSKLDVTVIPWKQPIREELSQSEWIRGYEKEAIAINNEYNTKEKKEGRNENIRVWKDLDTFTRFSNARSAAGRRILTGLICEGYLQGDIEEQKDAVLRIEHKMWSRYHLINNWSCGKKNKEQRIHNDLTRFDNLSETEIKKDEDTWIAVHNQSEIRIKKYLKENRSQLRTAKKIVKHIQAFKLGDDTNLERKLLDQNRLKRRSDGKYEVFSKEVLGKNGELAEPGDYIRLDNNGGIYPINPNAFEKTVEIHDEEYWTREITVSFWTRHDKPNRVISYCIKNGVLRINNSSKRRYYSAYLWGTTEYAPEDAYVVIYSSDLNTGVVDFNFVRKEDFNNSYIEIYQ